MRIFLVLVMTVLLLPVRAFPEQTLDLGMPDDPLADISSRVLMKAYARLKITIRLLVLPAERSLLESNGGQLDGEVNRIAGIEKAYSNLVRVPVPINVLEAVAFSKRQRFAVNGPESLKPYSIAIRIGTKFAEQLTQGLNVTRFPDFEKLFALLSEERYDIGIAARITGLEQIKKQGLKGIIALEPPLAVYDLFHYLHRKHAALVPLLTHTLQQMEKEGAIARIRERYINDLLTID